MTETAIFKRSTALQEALYAFSDAIAASGGDMSPTELKDAINDICIHTRTPVAQLPRELQELHGEAVRRLRDLEKINFNADSLQRTALALGGNE